jgi:hypothetical protein
MHGKSGFLRAWLLLLGIFSASSAMAVNSYPAKWRFLDMYGVNRTGYASCQEAGNAAMAIADRYYAPRVNVITNDDCPPPSNEVYWHFRQTDDFPNSPDDQIYMHTYCENGTPYVLARYSPALGHYCNEGTPLSKSVGYCPTCVGNPVHPITGNKFQVELDYQGSGVFPLKFERFYNSINQAINRRAQLGPNWSHTYNRRLSFGGPDPSTIALVSVDRPDGKVLSFALSGSTYVADPDVVERLEKLNGTWKYTNHQDEVEIYDSTGRLISISNRQGVTQWLSYSTSGPIAGCKASPTTSAGSSCSNTTPAG